MRDCPWLRFSSRKNTNPKGPFPPFSAAEMKSASVPARFLLQLWVGAGEERVGLWFATPQTASVPQDLSSLGPSLVHRTNECPGCGEHHDSGQCGVCCLVLKQKLGPNAAFPNCSVA